MKENKDFRKNEVKIEQSSILANALQQAQKQKEQEQQNRKDKTVKVGGKTYIIKRWKNTDALRRLPTIANLLFVPTAAPMAEALDFSVEGDNKLIPELFSAADMMTALFARCQDIHFAEFIIDLLDEVYLQGKSEPVDIDEDFDSPVETIPVVVEVLQANFMMQLCQDLLNMTPQLLQAQQINLAMTASSTQTSTEQ
ncbi:putative coil containing protein I [Vibrio phage VPMCC14]|nr:putative coil containing protein I [Vibrio phage VPMCC14]